MFSVDGSLWPWPCAIEREAVVRPSEISGMLLDKSYFNDVTGTYMQYTVSVAVPIAQRQFYSALYEVLTAPVDGHRFRLPYNQGFLDVTGRVEDVKDEHARLPGGGTYWKGCKFTLMANHPSRTVTLGEAIARGRAPVPEVSSPREGDTFTWVDGRWSRTASYPDADAIAY